MRQVGSGPILTSESASGRELQRTSESPLVKYIAADHRARVPDEKPCHHAASRRDGYNWATLSKLKAIPVVKSKATLGAFGGRAQDPNRGGQYGNKCF